MMTMMTVSPCAVHLGPAALATTVSSRRVPPRHRVSPSRAWLRGGALRIPKSSALTRRTPSSSPTRCCWSLEVSLATSAFVAATTTYLACRNLPRDRGNAVFLGVFGSMQLIDALLWWEHGSGMGLEACSMLNRVVTRAGIGIILLEPIAALIGTSMIAKKKPSLLEGALMLAEPALWPTKGDQSESTDYVMAYEGAQLPAAHSSSFTQQQSSQSQPAKQTTLSDKATDSAATKGDKKKTKKTHKFYRKSRVPENLDAIVVGSGIGGLSCASLLAKAGKRVLVLEKHYRPGGCTHAFTEVGENAFDSGIHYVGGGPVMTGLLSHVVAEPIELAQMGSEKDGYLYDRFDLGGGPDDMVNFRAGRDALVEELVSRYPHEESGIRRYMAAVEKAARGTNALMFSKFVPHNMPGRKAISKMLANIAQGYAERPASDVVADYVKDPELRALLAGGQMIDWNLAPDKVSWLVSAGMMNYYADGGFYPTGGSNKIPERIMPVIEEAGGAVLCKAAVERMLMDDATGRCVGVVMSNGDEIRAPVVVSGVGYENTFEKLLSSKDLERAGLDLSKSPSSTLAPSHGHMCAFISLDGPPEAFELKPWNIHSMPELPKYDHDMGKMQEDFYADPLNAQKECLMTLTCPSAKDPLYGEQYPDRSNVLLLVEGMHDWFAHMSDVQTAADTHGHRSPDYTALKTQFEDMFLERLYKYYPLTRGHVSHVELSTPLTSEHFLNAHKGASYGLEWTPEHFDPQMHEDWLNPTTKIPGLYLTGEAACFGGFYGALATGYCTASHVLGFLPLLWLLLNDKPPVNSSKTMEHHTH